MGDGGTHNDAASADVDEVAVPDRTYRSVLDAARSVDTGALSSEEREAVVHLVRTPNYWRSSLLSDDEVAWVRQVADDPGGITSESASFARSLDPARMVELTTIAAAVRSVDTYCFAAGSVQLPAGNWEFAGPNDPLDPVRSEYVAALVSYLNESVDDLAVHVERLRLVDSDNTLAPNALRLSRLAEARVGVQSEALIADFVRAAHDRDARRMVAARVELITVCGTAVASAVASVAGLFELVNRFSSAIDSGLVDPALAPQLTDLRERLGGPVGVPSSRGMRELGFDANEAPPHLS